MIDIPTVDNLYFDEKNVLVRGDFNVEDGNNPRVDSIRNIINLLKNKNAAKIKVIGHTETNYDLATQLRNEFPDVEFDSGLRNDPGEKENSMEFANKLSEGWNAYVNEAFSVSHREHASIVNLPKVITNQGGEVCLGLRFIEEIGNLSKINNDPNTPVIMVISGVKEDKLSYVESFSEFADKILIGGRLPEYKEKVEWVEKVELVKKVIWADLIADREDITIHSIEKFEKEIASAGTVVVSGPVGKFEDEGHRQGTERIFKAVVSNKEAFKVAGGGDTESAISLLGMVEGFNWISVGGGAMLEFLAKGTLPGIEALRV